MEKMKLLFMGFIIGLGKIIPGVSGSVMAIVFGLYERIVFDLSNFKNLKNDIPFISLVGIGVAAAILLGSKIIYYLLLNYYLYTVALFIGMMIPGVLSLFKNIENKDVTFKRVLISIIVFFGLIGLSIIDFTSSNSMNETLIHKNISLFLCGILDATATIVPGISGSALLMIVGYYESIISALGNVFSLESVKILIPFLLGMIVGVYAISKLITYLFKNHRSMTYILIISFATFSIFTLINKSLFLIETFGNGLLALSFLLTGIFISLIFDKIFKTD